MAEYLWGDPGAWTDLAPASAFSGLAAGGIVVGSPIDNTTLRRRLVEVSFISAVNVVMTAGASMPVVVLPRLHDGSSYPTNNTTSNTAVPGVGYSPKAITFPAGTLAPAGGVIVEVPAEVFELGIINQLGPALAANTTAYVCRWRWLREVVA